MIAVIIAGGSGSRLWPLSTPNYPKHLLKLTNDKSLLQNTFERAMTVTDDIYVISEASHAHAVYEQLSQLPKDHVIVEPGRRGTASCVIAALSRIKSNHDPSEAIVFMHADHHIRDTEAFTETIKRASGYAEKYQQLTMLGLEPTYPSTAFGYIERGDRQAVDQVFAIKSFKEKPDRAKAEAFVATGRYLWNMGYFVAPLSVFEAVLQGYAPQLWRNYQALLVAPDQSAQDRLYLDFTAEPIDIALIEKVPDLLVTPGTFDWMDIGSYTEIHQANPQDDEGNTVQGKIQIEHVSNSFLRNDTEVPIAVIGVDNVAVVMTNDGVIVTNKNYAQRVGDVSKKFQEGNYD